MLELENITAGYGDTVVLRDVSLSVPDAKVVALLGPNGAGKTTLLRVASGVITPMSGRVLLNGEDVTEAIRGPQVGSAASQVAAVPAVRRALVAKQRAMGETRNVVMEGRDVGTVVFPDAKLKVYLDAEPHERVRRRAVETTADHRAVHREIHDRDRRDQTRGDSPLTQAPDAVYLDNTQLSLDEVEEELLKLLRARTTNGKEHS